MADHAAAAEALQFNHLRKALADAGVTSVDIEEALKEDVHAIVRRRIFLFSAPLLLLTACSLLRRPTPSLGMRLRPMLFWRRTART